MLLLLLSALAAEGDLYVSDFGGNRVLRFDGATGALVETVVSTGLNGAAGIAFRDNGELLVGSGAANTVRRYAADDFTDLGTWSSGGVSNTRGIAVGPNGNLFVLSRSTNAVIEYDSCSGALVGTFASSDLNAPIGLDFADNGDLFVTSLGNDRVVHFDSSGNRVRSLTAGVSDPLHVLVVDGQVLVGNAGTNEILAFDATTGAANGVWASGMNRPAGMAEGPNGNVYVGNEFDQEVVELDRATGALVRVFVAAGAVTPWDIHFEPPRLYDGPVDMPGFLAADWATADQPMTLSFGANGELFVGKQGVPNTGQLDVITRVPPGGGTGTGYGTAILDPDTVYYDAVGLFSGVPGAVVVGGICAGAQGCYDAIRPDQTTVRLFGPSSSFFNPFDIVLHPDGRLLATDHDLDEVQELGSTGPSTLYAAGRGAAYIDVRTNGDILTTDLLGNVRVHDAAGTLIDPAFVTGLGTAPPIAVGPATGSWNGDLYAVDETLDRLIRVDDAGTITTIGEGFCGEIGDMVFHEDALYVSFIDRDTIVRIEPDELPPPPPVCAARPADMALWWTGDTTAVDRVTGASPTGGTPSFGPGLVGDAFALSGGITFPDMPALQPGNSYTVMLWIRGDLDDQPAVWTVLDKSHGAAFDGASTGWAYQGRGGALSFHMGADATLPGVYNTVGSSGTVLDGDWHHVAMTWSYEAMTPTQRFYRDGVLVHEIEPTGPAVDNTGPLTLGNWTAGGRAFDGAVDDVLVFARALDPLEIADIHAASSEGLCDATCGDGVCDPADEDGTTCAADCVEVCNGVDDDADGQADEDNVCGCHFGAFLDSEYAGCARQVTFDQAQTICGNFGYGMVQIDSAEEERQIVRRLRNTWDDRIWWLGATDRDEEGTFTWLSGDPVTYASWEPGQPDAHLASQDCLGLWANPGTWYDMRCERRMSFICERPR